MPLTLIREYATMDKTSWEDGPWTDEPDKRQYRETETGLPCLIVRNRMGALCGYVGVPKGHAVHGVDYDNVRVEGDDDWPDVHGGLTFAGSCHHGDEAQSICHVPEPGEPDDVWWLGFDCAHSGDLCPSQIIWNRDHGFDFHRSETYRDVAYVEREIERLATQLVTAKAETA